jgi:hypothetical protein
VPRFLRRRLALLVAAGAVQLATTSALKAQSTFDGDITGAGHHQLALDILSYVAPADAGGWTWFNPRVYRGFSHDIELGAGLSHFAPATNGDPSALQPSIKWRVLRDTTHHLTLSTGAQALLALHRTDDSYGLAFVSVDAKLHESERAAGAVAVGTYTLVHREAAVGGDRRGAIVSGWEAVGPVRVSGSWITGRNFYGYRSGAITYTTASQRWFTVGYSQGNEAYHNAGPYVSTGRAF